MDEIHKKAINGSTYYYTAYRDKDGEHRTVYLGAKRDEARRKEREVLGKHSWLRKNNSARNAVLALVFLIGLGLVYLSGQMTGFFTFSPEMVEFDLDEGWNLSETLLRVSMGSESQDIAAMGLVNDDKIQYTPDPNLNQTGRLYIDLIAGNELIESKYIDIEEKAEPAMNGAAEVANETHSVMNETQPTTNETVTNQTGQQEPEKEKPAKQYKKAQELRIKMRDREGREVRGALRELTEERITLKADKAELTIKGLRTTTDFEVKTGRQNGREILAVQKADSAEDLKIDSASITLPSTGDVRAIGYCPDEQFNYETMSCSQWQATSIPFTDNGDTITFTVDHFSAYSGLSAVIINGVNLSKYSIATDTLLDYRGLVGWYKLEKGNGTFWNDSSGNGNFGTCTGTICPTSSSEGAVGRSLFFDGVNDNIDIISNPSLNISGSAITVAAWANFNESNNIEPVIAKQNSYWLLKKKSGNDYVAQFGVRSGNELRSVNGSANISTGSWHHLAGTYDGTDLKIYVDSVLQGTNSESGSLTGQNNSVKIGGYMNYLYDTFEYATAGQILINGSKVNSDIGNWSTAAPGANPGFNYYAIDDTDYYTGKQSFKMWGGEDGSNVCCGAYPTISFALNRTHLHVHLSENLTLSFAAKHSGITDSWSRAQAYVVFKMADGTSRTIYYFFGPDNGDTQWYRDNGYYNGPVSNMIVLPQTASTWFNITRNLWDDFDASTNTTWVPDRNMTITDIVFLIRDAQDVESANVSMWIDDLRLYTPNNASGNIDEAMIWNRSLSQAEITNLYNRTKNIYTQHDLGASIVNSSELPTNTTVSYSYDWRLFNRSIALVNMNFDLNGSQGTGGNWTTVEDYSTYANHAEYNGSESTMPYWNRTGGYDGKGAYEFDGIGDHLNIANSGTYANISMSAWVKVGIVPGSISNIVSGTGIFSDVDIYDNLFQIYDGGGWRSTTTTINRGQWYFVTFTFLGGTKELNLYVNGKNEYSSTGLGTATNGRITKIGKFTTDIRYFNGTIDQVQIFNRSLSAAQIKEMYADGVGHYNVLVDEETAEGDNWTVAVTPIDGDTDGLLYLSNIADITQMLTLNWTAAYNASGVEVNETTWVAGGTNISFNATVHIPEVNVSTVWVVVWKTIKAAGDILWEGIMELINGIYSIIMPTNTSFFHFTNYTIYANDTSGTQTSADGTFFYNYKPNVTAADLAATLSNNYTTENLTLSGITIADNDSDAYNYTINWILNGTSITVLNMPFDLNGTGGSQGNWTTTRDYSSYGNNAEYNGSEEAMPRWNRTGGYDGRGAYEFDGIDDYLIIKNLNTRNTTSLWFRNATGWFHYVNASGTYYLNGTLSVPIAEPLYSDGTNTYIGKSNANAYFNGTIDQAQIFNRTLGPDQIAAMYNAGTGNYNIIIKNETRKGESWQAAITPQDPYEDGATFYTANLTIRNYPPGMPTPVTPANNSNVTTGTPTFVWANSYDNDTDALTYILEVSNDFAFTDIAYTNKSIAETSNITNDTSTALTDGSRYWRVRANDGEANSSWSTIYNMTIAAGPVISNITANPNTTADVDPNKQINVTATITSALGISTAILQWKETAEGDWSNKTMQNTSLTSFESNFTTSATEAIYYYRIWANNSAGSGYSDTYNVTSTWEYGWNASWLDTGTKALGSVSALLNIGTVIGSIILNNTGDATLTFDMSDNSPYGISYNYTKPFSLAAKGVKTLKVNATGGSTTREDSFSITATASHAIYTPAPTSNVLNATLVSYAGGPYFDAAITSYPASVTQSTGNHLFKAYVKNLGNETATNTTITWTLPTGWNNQSNLTETNINITSTGGIYYINLTAEATATASASATNTITLTATSQNNATDTASATVTVICNGTDSTCGTGCTTSNDANCITQETAAASAAASGGTGGGTTGVSLSPATKNFLRSNTSFEIVRGITKDFEIIIANPYENSTMIELDMNIEGFLAQYVEILSSMPKAIPYGKSEPITIRITAPAYMKYGNYTLVATITGKVLKAEKKTDFVEKRTINLLLQEISEEKAIEAISTAETNLQEMNEAGFSTDKVKKLLTKAQEYLKKKRYELAQKAAEQIFETKATAFETDSLLKEVEDSIKQAENKGLKAPETSRVYGLALAAFQMEDYETAIQRIKEAQFTIVVETKGKVNIVRLIITYWWQILVGLAALSLTSLLGFNRLQAYNLFRNLRNLDKEEININEMIKQTQTKCFDEKKLSVLEYHKLMYQYNKRLEEIREKRVTLRSKRIGVFRLTNELKNLQRERGYILRMIERVQRDYFELKVSDYSTYTTKMAALTGRKAEIQKDMALMEAKAKVAQVEKRRREKQKNTNALERIRRREKIHEQAMLELKRRILEHKRKERAATINNLLTKIGLKRGMKK